MLDMCPTAANGDMISGVELSQSAAAACYPQFGTLPLAELVRRRPSQISLVASTVQGVDD